jgi:isoleucyl-tRNA synthetase
LKELVVFHPDQGFFDDITPLRPYLETQLNVRGVLFTSDEEKTGIRFKATADWPSLGKKLRKDLARVKSGLPNLTSNDVKTYVETGTIEINGIKLEKGDLVVGRYVDLPEEQGWATNTDGDVVVLLDTKTYPELEAEGLAREFINRCQRLRKEAGLQATDDVDVFYEFEPGTGTDILAAIITHAETVTKTVRSAPADVVKRPPNTPVLIERRQEISETAFVLSLVRR